MLKNEYYRSVTLELSQANINDFDTEEYISALIAGKFNTIVCFAVGYLNGETYFDSKILKKNPLLKDRDIFKELSVLKKKYRFNFFAYLNTQFSDIGDKNSTWSQRRIDGEKTKQLKASTICPNSPYKEILLKTAKEISSKYDIDGFYFDEVSFQSWCNCNFCKKKYFKETGLTIPKKTNFNNSLFLRWMSWREKIINNFMKDFYNNLKKINKNYIIFFQSAFPISSTFIKMKNFQYVNPIGSRVPKEFVGYYRPSFYGQNIEINHHYSDILSLEPWRKIAGTPIWWPGLCTSYVKNLNKNKTVLPLMELPHFPWSLINLPKDEIIFNIADVQANGGGTWYPMYSPDKRNLNYWSEFSKIFDKFNKIPNANNRIIDVALVFSKNNAEKTNNNKNEDNYIDDFNNTVSLLKNIKINFTTFSFNSISLLKNKPRIILLINHKYFTKKEYLFFNSYVRNGGSLICWGKPPTHLENNFKIKKDNKFLTNIFSVDLISTRPFFGYLKPDKLIGDGLCPTYGLNNFFKNISSKKIGYLFEGISMFATPDIKDLTPAIFSKKINKGKSIIFSNNIALIWKKTKSTELTNIIKNLFFKCLDKKNVFYSNSNEQFNIYVWKNREHHSIWLTNYSGIEQNGFCNKISKIELLIPKKFTNITNIKNYNNTSVYLKKNIDNRILVIKNLNIWECITFKSRK